MRAWVFASVFLASLGALTPVSAADVSGAIRRFKGSRDHDTKMKAIDALVEGARSSTKARRFLRGVLVSADIDATAWRRQIFRGLLAHENPEATLVLLQAFVPGNKSYFEDFRGDLTPTIHRAIAVELIKPVLRSPKASPWDSGRAFFVSLLPSLEVKEAARLVKGLLRCPTPELRRACVTALPGLDPEGAFKAIKPALRDRDASVREAAVVALAELGGDAAAGALLAQLKDPSQEMRALAVVMMGRFEDSPRITRGLIACLEDPELRRDALISLLSCDPIAARPQFLKACGHKSWRMRFLATFYLKELGLGSAALPIYKARLGDNRQQVASAAVRGLEDLRSREATGVLIEALDSLRGLERADALAALKRLTDEDFGDEPGRWLAWWAEVRDKFEPVAADNPVRLKTMERSRFFGRTVESGRVAFIIDFSGSMNSPMVLTRAPRGGGTVERGAEEKPAASRVISRRDLAKAELLDAIARLDSRARFNIAFFGSEYELWKKAALPADKARKAEASAFIRANRLTGLTNLYDPLEHMLLDPEIDTVYLLSDGAPNEGKHSRPEAILKAVRELNAERQVIIHTLGFGVDGEAEDLLRRLAEEHGGSFTEIDGSARKEP